MATAYVNDTTIGVESFGADDAPLMLLVGGPTMLSWPDSTCKCLAGGGRRVVRYDSVIAASRRRRTPEAPAYTLRDLTADAAASVEAFGGGPAHLAGIGIGGMVAPGPVDAGLPDHDQATMSRVFALPMADWADRGAVGDYAAARAQIRGDDPVAARAVAARVWDRAPSDASAVQVPNQLGTTFRRLDCAPRSVALQHSGSMSGGTQTLHYAVVPGSGTENLTGTTGTLDLTIDDDGTHRYRLRYAG